MLKSALQKIGLSDKDAEVYLACLELGTQPASVIAKKTGLKRPTTYLILEGLVHKGLVSEYSGTNVKFFTAVQPDYLLHYLEKQRRELQAHERQLTELLPQFHSLANPYSLNPRVRFFDGIEGIEAVMEDTLTSKNPICCYSSIDSWFSKDDLKKYIIEYGKKRVFEKKIPLRGIILDTPAGRKYLEEDYPPDAKMTETRWCPKDIALITSEINIYDNKIAICSLGRHDLIGVIIESEDIANTQRSIFELAWRAAIKGKPIG